MNAHQRLKLQEMITENNVVDNTQLIRMFKHSQKIRDDVTTMAYLKRDYSRLDKARFTQLCTTRCSFLAERYPELFQKIMRQEINMDILDKVLTSLKKIEDSELDQHEASFEVGELLKKMYVDSAMRRQRAREEKDRKAAKKTTSKSVSDLKKDTTGANLSRCTSWRDFKNTHLS